MTRRLAIWLIIVLIFIATIIAAANSSETVTSAAAPLSRHGVTYNARVIQSGDTKKTVALIPITGVMTTGSSAVNGSSTGSEDIVRMLDAVGAAGKRFDGVILELDTGGGAVLAAQEIHEAIRRLQTKHKKPVVAWMRGAAASAGYYVSAPAERIIAADTTFTGSIGVIMEYYNVGGLAKKLGVEQVIIKSAEMKDAGSAFRKLKPAERAVFQSVINEAYTAFVDVVAEGRDLDKARVLKLADGRIYTGRQAKKNGLVDALGLRSDAYTEMAKLLKLKKGEELKVVSLARNHSFLQLLSADSTAFLSKLDSAITGGRILSGDVSAVQDQLQSQAGNGVFSLQYRVELP